MSGEEAGKGALGQAPAGRVERFLGKPASAWSADDLIALAKEEEIRIVSLMHVGGDGSLKTLDFVPLSRGHLRDILEGGERADGSSLFAGTGIRADASDVVLRPRIASAFLDPFSPHPTLALLAGHLGRDGNPLPESPDTIIRRAHERVLALTGVELRAHGEVEYFLGKQTSENDVYGADDRGYHATAPFVFGEALRRRAMAILGDMGVAVKYGHSEVGCIVASEADGLTWEQHEIELSLAPLPAAADQVVLTHWVLRQLAHTSGMRVSFDPILRRGHPGSGLHFHLSPCRNGAPTGVAGDDGVMTPEARWLIGGLVAMGGALMAFGNRSEGSFTRLIQGKEAPNTVTWDRFNRHALIRLPIQARTEAGRVVTPPTVEFRLPDGSAHPHLLLAGIAQALVLGRETRDLDALLERTRVRAASARDRSQAPVPRDFEEVARALEDHRAILERDEVFPKSMVDAVLEQLRAGRSESAKR